MSTDLLFEDIRSGRNSRHSNLHSKPPIMKKSLFALILALVFVSCTEKKAIDTPIDYAVISGTISNASVEEISINNLFDSDFSKKIKLDENGMFRDTMKLANNDSYNLRYSRTLVPLFVQKGDHLTVNFDAEKVDSTLYISGKGSAVSNYLFKKKNIGLEKGEAPRNAMMRVYALEETSFIDTLVAKKMKQEYLLSNTDGLSEDFKKNEQANIAYEYQSSLLDYNRIHRYISKNPAFEVSESFKKKMKTVSFEKEEDFNFSENYRALISTSLMNRVQDTLEKDSTLDYGTVYLEAINNAVKNQNIKNKLAYDNAKNAVTYANDPKVYYDLYLQTSVDETYNKKITEIYNKVAALVKGSASPKFVDYENNAGGKTSLADLKGKYVYVDVWATWCGPCIREIPALKQVEKEFHAKNIEFVSISIDAKKDHEKWKEMIVDKELGGMQLFADNAWQSQFIEDYVIKGIPRFILIDPDGNIVDADAPRPSSKKLVDLFEEVEL